ncbi:MAG: 4-(cytidine 5'-diphospho)-2-C-methyl-D-erythritol kinase [Holophagales bacterium]|jgi:4-diphosphocytidyl-2-C-methyl-D-erythritol kinase|nr:4-(cytidine 5'-diphospho)-2-C-methyl-D-erythritol kinase [Holophagales bacterium]
MIKETAPAKFNRFLSVLGRRPDGFHLLELVTTVLQDWPSLFDELTTDVAKTTKLSLEIEGPASGGLQPDESNLVIRAWRLLEKESGKTLNAKIKLFKNIPHSAGLGGGSSDAAAALKAGNKLFQLGLSNSTLLRLAAELGSDVPLFLLGGTVMGLDLGQRVIPMRDIPLPPMFILHPGFCVSTPSVYKALTQEDLSRTLPCPSLSANEAPPWRNDLTNAALKVCPAMHQVREALISVGGEPMLCGSGSCWAARFMDRDERDTALQKISARYPGWRFYSDSV